MNIAVKRVTVSLLVLLAACGGGGGDPAELAPKTTRMACTDKAGTTPAWWAEVTIDPAEFPWRSMSVTTQLGPYFISDPQGDIVNARGIAAPAPAGSPDAGQSSYVVQTFQTNDNSILVSIAAPDGRLDLFTFRTDGTMIQLGESASASRPETICKPQAAS